MRCAFLTSVILVVLGSAVFAAEPRPYSSPEAWKRAVPDGYERRAEYQFVSADPALPNVLLIGDSISMSYTVPVRQRLAGVANVYRAPNNCRSTRQTLAEIETYLGRVDWDVIHFNWGIHDITHLNDQRRAVPPPEGKLQVGMEEYRDNLAKLVKRLKQTGAKLIWASTTPVGQKAEAKGYRRDRDVVAYNAMAAERMKKEEIAINDLYALVKPRAEQLLSDGVHFNAEGTKVLAKAVSEAIRAQLAGLPDSGMSNVK